jgi:hypothetical protein
MDVLKLKKQKPKPLKQQTDLTDKEIDARMSLWFE